MIIEHLKLNSMWIVDVTARLKRKVDTKLNNKLMNKIYWTLTLTLSITINTLTIMTVLLLTLRKSSVAEYLPLHL